MSNPQTEPAGPKLEAGNEGESFRRYRLRTMTRIIYDQDVLSVGGNIATAIIMVIYVNGFISPFWIRSFVASWGVWCVIMLLVNWRFTKVRDDQSARQYGRWVIMHRVLDFGNCLNFSGGVYMLARSSAAEGVWIATITGALYSCAAVLTVAWDLGSFLSSLPIIVLTLVWIQLAHGSIYLAVGLFTFLIFAIFSVNELQKGYARSISLGYENLHLANKLEIEKSKAVAEQRIAEEANLAKSQFFAAANHDLRQPLHALTLGIQNLKLQTHSPGAQQALDITELASSSLVTLFNQLMEVAKLDSGTQRADHTHFPLQPMLYRLRGEFSPIAREKQIRLVFKTTTAITYSDELSVERMLRNLIGNALKFTDHGTVLVACRPLGNQLRIQVWDTGMGIAAHDLSPIFEEFRQINPQEQRRGQAEGLGLGLSIVNRLANLIGTHVRVKSNLAKGSLFEFSLPVGALDSSTALNLATHSSQQRNIKKSLKTGLKIFLLEDDELGRAALKALLESWGAAVQAYHSTEQLLADLGSPNQWPDVAILDFQIGNLTSAPAIDRLLDGEVSKTKIIVISGGTGSAVAQYTSGGRVSFLSKPVDPDLLFNHCMRT